MYEVRFMRLLVLFDLPTKTKKDRKNYTKFRKFLLQNGFFMIQFSVYYRVCKGQEVVKKHIENIKLHLPPKGNIKIIQITNKQFEQMLTLLGNNKKEEEFKHKQLLLF